MILRLNRLAVYIKFLPLIFFRIYPGYDLIFNSTWNHIDRVFEKLQPTMEEIKAYFEKIWETKGRCQKVTRKSGKDFYSYTVEDCIFYKVAKLYASKDTARAICEADECYWINKLQNTGISLKKEKYKINNVIFCNVEFRIV